MPIQYLQQRAFMYAPVTPTTDEFIFKIRFLLFWQAYRIQTQCLNQCRFKNINLHVCLPSPLIIVY